MASATWSKALVLLLWAAAGGARAAALRRGCAAPARAVATPRARVRLMPPAKRAKAAGKAAAPAAAADEDADPAEALAAWLEGQGVSMARVRIEQHEPNGLGWGLRAAAPAAAGEVLAAVPAACVLRPDAAVDGALAAALGVEVPEELWALQLGLRLLREHLAPTSACAAYTRALPGRFACVPLTFRDDELRALKSDAVARHVFQLRDVLEALCAALAESSDPLAARAFPAERPSRSDLVWACAAALSRALPASGDGGERALVPLLDLCNHASQPSCELRRDGATGAYSLVALGPLAAGAALTVHYGEVGAAERLLRFGFVDESDPADFVSAPFDWLMLDTAYTLGEPKPLDSALHVGAAPPRPRPPRSPDDAELLEQFQIDALTGLGLYDPECEGSADDEQYDSRPSRRTVRFYADRLDGRLLASLRVLYAQHEDELRGLSLPELQSSERLLDDALEEQVRQTAVGYAMAVAGNRADAGLTAGLGGGTGRTDSHMLVAGRAATNGALSTNGRAALAFRSAQMRTSIAALRYAKSTLMHALPITSSFAQRGGPADDDGYSLEDVPELSELEELELLERQGKLGDELWAPQLSDLDAF